MWLEDGMVENHGGISIKAGDTHNGVYKGVDDVIQEAYFVD